MKRLLLLLFSAASAAALPSVGPDYVRPAVPVPGAYRDATPDEDRAANQAALAWKEAAPNDAVERGAWWRLFGDEALDGLETQALAANQDLRAAAARVDQARAAAGLARARYWPQVALDGSVTRARTSSTIAAALPESLSTTHSVSIDAAWELDLFGRVRRLAESARAGADAGADAFSALRLALTADVAKNYFSLRATDRESAVVRDTLVLRRQTLELVRAQMRLGSAADFDVARAETELAITEADSSALSRQRSALQNALAVLAGQPAPDFDLRLSGAPLAAPPAIPVGLPANLLERRPDVAAAERALVASNARIGVARAAFFPAISLTAGAGSESSAISQLFRTDSRAWAFGPSLYLPLFQGGRNRANLERSRAAYDESVAGYRQRILVAFSEVQNALAAGHWLADQAAAQDRALAGARRAADLAQIRYAAGYIGYLDLIEAQRTALVTSRESAQIAGLRLVTGVALIEALGGGWRPDAPLVVASK